MIRLKYTMKIGVFLPNQSFNGICFALEGRLKIRIPATILINVELSLKPVNVKM